jgi:sn-glycerol 3-phosphate transport system ATP-binding protein
LAGVALRLDFSLPIQGPVTVGVRAESIDIGDGPLTFESDLLEHLGATQLIHGNLGKSPLVISVPTGHQLIRPVERLQLSVRTADLHFFDPASGRRIQTSPV